WRGEIENQEIGQGLLCRWSRVEWCPPGLFAPLDEHLQAVRYHLHARAWLLRVRSKREEVSRFSGRNRRQRARIFLSGPGKNNPARGGPRGARLESVPQPVSRAARGQARAIVAYGPRIFHQQRF